MKTISIYPVFRLDIEVPDDYEGAIEEDAVLRADFSRTQFFARGCSISEHELCGFNEE